MRNTLLSLTSIITAAMINCGPQLGNKLEYKASTDALTEASVDMNKPLITDLTSRLVLLERASKDFPQDIYYDTQLKMSCSGGWFPSEIGVNRCLPLMELTNIGCFDRKPRTPAFTRETGFWKYSTMKERFGKNPVYQGELAGKIYSSGFLYYSFGEEEFHLVQSNYSGTYECNTTVPAHTSWSLTNPTKLNASDFALYP